MANQPRSNAPARQERPPETTSNDLRRLLEQYKGQIEMALPKHVTPERMIRVALTAFSRTPLLAKCSATSICGALVQASILGLEPDGLSGEAFLIPYWSTKAGGYECQMQPGYKGLVKLARNTGEISTIDAQPVHDKDEFDFQKGSCTSWTHKWNPREPRGPIYGYWAGYVLKDGGSNFEFMSVGEIEAHRDQYSQGAYKKERGQFVLDAAGAKILTGPWKDSPDWMYRKTPLIQVLKLAPKTVHLHTALNLDNQAEAGQGQHFVDLPKELNPPVEDPPEQPAPVSEIPDPQPKDAAPKTGEALVLITTTQAKRLEQMAEDCGWRQSELLAFLKKHHGISSVHDVKAADYDRICEHVKGGVPAKEPVNG